MNMSRHAQRVYLSLHFFISSWLAFKLWFLITRVVLMIFQEQYRTRLPWTLRKDRKDRDQNLFMQTSFGNVTMGRNVNLLPRCDRRRRAKCSQQNGSECCLFSSILVFYALIRTSHNVRSLTCLYVSRCCEVVMMHTRHKLTQNWKSIEFWIRRDNARAQLCPTCAPVFSQTQYSTN
jgi:hypothetical protein